MACVAGLLQAGQIGGTASHFLSLSPDREAMYRKVIDEAVRDRRNRQQPCYERQFMVV